MRFNSSWKTMGTIYWSWLRVERECQISGDESRIINKMFVLKLSMWLLCECKRSRIHEFSYGISMWPICECTVYTHTHTVLCVYKSLMHNGSGVPVVPSSHKLRCDSRREKLSSFWLYMNMMYFTGHYR